MRPVIVSCEGIIRELGTENKTRILHGVDLQVREGEFVALTGASGSGKSTLLYVLGALDRPTEGKLVIDGTDVSTGTDATRAQLRNEKLGFVFQFHFLLPEFSVVENIEIPMMRRGCFSAKQMREMAMSTLADLKIDHLAHRKPSMLSGGQQQRVSIARAIAQKPKVLLADEPTGNLDSVAGQAVMQVFEDLASKSSMSIIMVTHEPSFAARTHREVRLKDGRIGEQFHWADQRAAGGTLPPPAHGHGHHAPAPPAPVPSVPPAVASRAPSASSSGSHRAPSSSDLPVLPGPSSRPLVMTPVPPAPESGSGSFGRMPSKRMPPPVPHATTPQRPATHPPPLPPHWSR
jgi:lipoprotein-releasing system ATP-binding protein